MATYKFEEGVMWDDNPWTIETDYECSEYGGEPCKHCSPIYGKRYEDENPAVDARERKWTCPRVVIAVNEGGYNSTGVCLDCILEAAEYVNKSAGK